MPDRLFEVFSDVLGVSYDALSDDTSPANTPEWDSIASINLTLGIEYEFKVKLTMQEIMSMQSIGKARGVLTKKGAA